MAKKAKSITKDVIVEQYMTFILTNGKKPHNVYEFTKHMGFEESSFYEFYSDFEQIETNFLGDMFDYSLSLIKKNDAYENYDASQKLSALYFTFIEMATANRSFIKYILDADRMSLKQLSKLKSLREKFLVYVNTILSNPIKLDIQSLNKVQNKVLVEGAWTQFISIIAFWINDKSSNFEKTDVYIEKTVNASFDVVYNVPFESLFDFGKFLWKEKMSY